MRQIWKSRHVTDAAAWVIVLVAAASVVWLYPNWSTLFPKSDAPAIPKEPLSLDGATLKGSSEAPVVLIEYSDYQCPYCRNAETRILPEISKQYIDSGRVQLAFRHHPIAALHRGATKAAEAALCAGRQGRFWEMHAALFQDQQHLDQASLMTRAHVLELDEDTFRTCLEGGVLDRVQQDSNQAEELGLSGTPAFLIGTRMADGRLKVAEVLVGAQPVERFRKALNKALNTVTRGSISPGLSAWVEVGGGPLLSGYKSNRYN